MTTIYKNVKQCKKRQKWAQNAPKMDKFLKKNVHRFSGSKLPTKMVLVIFTRCLVPEICILCHFGLKMGLKRPKNGPKTHF